MIESNYPPPPPPPQKNSRNMLIAVIVIVVVIVAAVIGAYFLMSSGNSSRTPSTGTPTPSPTSTPSPTQSSSQTPTPTATGASAVAILSSTDYVNSGGYFTVVGEVKNTLATNVALVKVKATFYDSSDTVIGTSFDSVELDILKPNQKCPFELSAYSSEITPARYELTVEYHATTEPPFEGLTITSHSGSTDGSGYYKITGDVQNNGAYKAGSIKIIGTYYNAAGKVIGTSYTYVDSAINVGESAAFDLNSDPLKINPASYELQVQGSRSYT